MTRQTRVIALVSGKGGVGRSTLTSALAVCAVKEGARVALIDAEPQESLTLWWRMRGKPGNPFLHPYSGDLLVDVQALRGEGYQWVFIDTVPAMMEHIEHAIEAADVVLIPTRVSLFDLAATRDVVALCQKHSKLYGFALNATDPQWKKGIQSALAVLKKLGPVIPKSIRQRTVYASALTTGKTGPERDKTAADEISALWASVKKLATAKARAK
jgi:chromosome partitioning protein